MKSPLHHGSVVLSTRGLGKQYANGTWGLRDASIALESGKMVAVLGPNGAGKSTLLHMLAGAILPTEGEFAIANPAIRIGWSSQRTTIDWYLNTIQNVELGGRLYGLSRKESRSRAMALLDRFRLADLARNDVSMLSGGQQQRIQVARTLMSEPGIMLLDEPTAALDVESSEDVLGYIQEKTQAGALALVSSHDLGQLERYCDEVLFVLGGRVIAHRAMADFLSSFATSESLQLSLSRPVDNAILAALEQFDPQTDAQYPHQIMVNPPEGVTLSEIVLALNGVAQVTDASRTPASLRNVYLHLTNQTGGRA